MSQIELDHKIGVISDKFHAHIDDCDQCKNNPFDLCHEGQYIISQISLLLDACASLAAIDEAQQ